MASDETTTHGPARYRGLPLMPADREPADRKNWARAALVELTKQSMGATTRAINLSYDQLVNEDPRTARDVQKLYGLLLCPNERARFGSSRRCCGR